MQKKNSKLWSGRFSHANNELMEKFNASISFDQKMYLEDITASIAHVKMLAEQKIIKKNESQKIIKGLKEIEKEIKNNQFNFSSRDEDIHMAVEKRLTAKIGATGKKLHTARSRNDQVSTDFRLYLRNAIDREINLLLQLLDSFLQRAEKSQKIILPGFTHLQSAQPITLSFYLLSYFFLFSRDVERLIDVRKRVNLSPLGSGAFAGVNYSIDRKMTCSVLGFDDLLPNAMDAVASRDFAIEYLAAVSNSMTNLSRINEEFILWSSNLFQFISIDDQYATGSSIMPNKKNPDACELIRGKVGRVNGNLISLLTTVKALPLAYNKDLQEDKESVFDSIEQFEMCLKIFYQLLKTTQFHPEKMLTACQQGFLLATDVADYLVKKGLAFREAHEVSGNIVKYLEQNQLDYCDLNFENYLKFSNVFEKDILQVLDFNQSIKGKFSEGSTSFKSVQKQLQLAKKKLVNFLKITKNKTY